MGIYYAFFSNFLCLTFSFKPSSPINNCMQIFYGSAESNRYSLYSMTSVVVLFAYLIKLNISTRKELCKFYQRSYIIILTYLSNSIKKMLDKISFHKHFKRRPFVVKIVTSCEESSLETSNLFIGFHHRQSNEWTGNAG